MSPLHYVYILLIFFYSYYFFVNYYYYYYYHPYDYNIISLFLTTTIKIYNVFNFISNIKTYKAYKGLYYILTINKQIY